MEAETADMPLRNGGSSLEELTQALERLDRRLEAAVLTAGAVYGSEAAADPFRGLHISEREVHRLLARQPLSPMLGADGNGTEARANLRKGSRLNWLAEEFNLSPFDVDVILIALAPELDLRYERLYAYLQDDVTRRRPTVDLALVAG